jgi:hypothetical protein
MAIEVVFILLIVHGAFSQGGSWSQGYITNEVHLARAVTCGTQVFFAGMCTVF